MNVSCWIVKKKKDTSQKGEEIDRPQVVAAAAACVAATGATICVVKCLKKVPKY